MVMDENGNLLAGFHNILYVWIIYITYSLYMALMVMGSVKHPQPGQ